MINIFQCHANSTVKLELINSLGAHFCAVLTHLYKDLKSTLFMSASILKECDTVQQTKLSQQHFCSLMQICILRKMTHDKYELKLIFLIDQCLMWRNSN